MGERWRESGERAHVREEVHIFVYGTLLDGNGAGALLDGCTRVGDARVAGTLYDVDGEFPALMLAGAGQVRGEIWRCPAQRIHEIDRYEAVESGLFRRVGLQVDGVACWLYVAGPALAPRLARCRRVPSGSWRSRDPDPSDGRLPVHGNPPTTRS